MQTKQWRDMAIFARHFLRFCKEEGLLNDRRFLHDYLWDIIVELICEYAKQKGHRPTRTLADMVCFHVLNEVLDD